jgi:hypothetical protein
MVNGGFETSKWIPIESSTRSSNYELGYLQLTEVGATEEGWHHYHGQRMLRLLLGDDGYVAWVAAQHAFVEGIGAASISPYGGKSTMEGRNAR